MEGIDNIEALNHPRKPDTNIEIAITGSKINEDEQALWFYLRFCRTWWEIERSRHRKLRIHVGSPSGFYTYNVVENNGGSLSGTDMLTLVHDVSQLSEAAGFRCKVYGACTTVIDHDALSSYWHWAHDYSVERNVAFSLRPCNGSNVYREFRHVQV